MKRAAFLLLAVVLVLVTVDGAMALTFINDSYGLVSQSSAADAALYGFNFTVTQDNIQGLSAQKWGADTSTRALLRYQNGTEIAIANFVGNVANFTGLPTLTKNTRYLMLSDANGGSRTVHCIGVFASTIVGNASNLTGTYAGCGAGTRGGTFVAIQFLNTSTPAIPVITVSLSNLVNGSSWPSTVTFSNLTGTLNFSYFNITGTGYCVTVTGNGTNTNCTTSGSGASTFFNVSNNSVSVTGTQTVNAGTYQALLNVSAYRLFLNTSIATYNTTNGVFKNVSGSLVYALNGSNNVQIDVAGNFSLNTTCSVTELFSMVQCNATGIHDMRLNVSANNGTAPLQNFTVTITNNTLGGTLYDQTITTSALFNLLQGYDYAVRGNRSSYITNTTTVTGDNATTTINLTLNPINIYITFLDENNRTLLPGINISVAVVKSDGTQELYSTNTSTLTISGTLPPGDYTFRYGATGYSLRDFYVTIEEANANLTMYLLIESLYTPGTVQVRNFDGVPLEGAIVRLIKYYGDPSLPNEVQDGTTNADGQTVFVAEVVTSFYLWEVEYDGELRFQSVTPELLVVDDTGLWSKTFVLNATLLERYSQYSGFVIGFTPTNNTLFNGTLYDFTANVTSNIWAVEDCVFTIYNTSNGAILAGPTSAFCTSTGGVGTLSFTTPIYDTRIRAEVTIETDEFTNTYYALYTISGYGRGGAGNFTLQNLADDLSDFSGAGFNGFSRFLLSIAVIIGIVLYTSRKTVLLGSPAETVLLIFALTLPFSYVGWLNLPGTYPVPAFAQWAVSIVTGLIASAAYLHKAEVTK